LPIAWYGLVVVCLTDSNVYIFFIISYVNCDLLSEFPLNGNLTRLKIPSNASATVLVMISLSATASGKRVHISISVRMYLTED